VRAREVLHVFMRIADSAGDAVNALAPIGGDNARALFRVAADLKRAAELGAEVARAHERFVLERERVAALLRGTAEEIETPPGLRVTFEGEEVKATAERGKS
jgi:predicted aldo/keto reductase-like oxidoreductase